MNPIYTLATVGANLINNVLRPSVLKQSTTHLLPLLIGDLKVGRM